MFKLIFFLRLIIIPLILLGAPFHSLGAQKTNTLPHVVICPFSTAQTQEDRFTSMAGAISDLLLIELSQSERMVVVDRSLTDRLFNEIGLLSSGLGRGEGNAVLIGRIAKADMAVSGVVIQKDRGLYIIIRVFNPVTGILLDVDKIVFHPEDLQRVVENISRFVHNALSKIGKNHKKRFFAFKTFEAIVHNPHSLSLSQELIADLEKRYVDAPDVGIVVRSGIDSLLVEHYLESVANTERESVLADAKSASAIIDLRFEGSDQDDKAKIRVSISFVGFSRQTFSHEFDAMEKHEAQLGAWMDKKLHVHSKIISHEQRKLAHKIYKHAMEMGRFSYKPYNKRMCLRDGSGCIRNWGHIMRVQVHKDLKNKLPQLMDAFEQVLSLDPTFHKAMPPLAYCYVWKTTHNPKRGKELLRKVYHESSDHDLKRIAQEIIWGSPIRISELNDFGGKGELLFNELLKNQYIEEQGYRLIRFDKLKTAAQLKLSSTFSEYKEEIFGLLAETKYGDGYFLSQPYQSSSLKEAVSHYELGLQKSGFSFKKAFSRINKEYGMSYEKYLHNFDTVNPEIIVDNKIAAMTKSNRKNQLQEAINEFSSALFLDPLFHEAMLMLAHCLRDPLVGQTDRADRLCQVVLSESSYKYFRTLAKSMLSRQQDTATGSPMVPPAKKHHVTSSRSTKPRDSEAASTPQPTVLVQFAPIEGPGRNQLEDPENNHGKTEADESSLPIAKVPQAHQSINFKKTRIRIEETQLERYTPTSNGRIFSRRIPSIKTILHRNRMFLGTSVAINEDIAVVAAPWANHGDKYYGGDKYGALFLFKRNSDRWSYESKLVSGRPSFQFGRAVDISDSRIIAGAPFDNYKGPVRLKDFHNIRFESSINLDRLLDKLFQRGYLNTYKMVTDKFKGELNDAFMRDFPECTAEDLKKIIKILKASQSREKSGSAYIFEKTSNGWQKIAILSAVDACSENNFGRYVAVSGDHAVIGSSSGAYFFHFKEGYWTQTVKRCEGKSGPKPVDIMGRYAICATHSSVLIFFWDGNQWTQQAILTEDSSATQNREYFGSAVAMGADFAVVSNNIRQHISVDPQNPSTGTVYVYKRDGSNWSLWTTLTGERNGQAENFGESLAISGPYILVAAPSHHRFRHNEAAVYLYEVQDKKIIHHGRVSVAGSRTSDKKIPKKLEGFGCAVAMHGQNIVVGAMKANDVDNQGRKAYEGGAAYLFEWN